MAAGSPPPPWARLATNTWMSHTGSPPPTPGPRERARRTWCEQLTWSGLGGQVGAQAAGGAGVGAEPAAVEQRLQRVLLRGPRLAAEAGAAALGVYTARVPFAQRASQAAAAAGFSHQLRARGRGGRRRALGQRTRVARFAAHHGARAHRARAGPRHRRPAEQSECGERSGPERGARGMHGARRAEGGPADRRRRAEWSTRDEAAGCREASSRSSASSSRASSHLGSLGEQADI